MTGLIKRIDWLFPWRKWGAIIHPSCIPRKQFWGDFCYYKLLAREADDTDWLKTDWNESLPKEGGGHLPHEEQRPLSI